MKLSQKVRHHIKSTKHISYVIHSLCLNEGLATCSCGMKFKDFQAPVLFSSTFKALNLAEKNSSTFKYFQGCVETLYLSSNMCDRWKWRRLYL